MIRTCKQLENKLNEMNSVKVEVKKVTIKVA